MPLSMVFFITSQLKKINEMMKRILLTDWRLEFKRKSKFDMINKLLLTKLILLVSITLFAQKQEKIFYDEDWKICSQEKAEYYRLITLDSDGKPVGKVYDYYLSGELQWEGEFSYFTRTNDEVNIPEGTCIWYYKNGKKSRESYFIHGKEQGITTYWYENGKIHRKYNFTNGKLTDKFFIDCDEFGKCQNIFVENFYSKDNLNQWDLGANDERESRIIPKTGLLIRSKIRNAFQQTINISLDLAEDFSIETIVKFLNGEQDNGLGLIWGFKDWDNYFRFLISANGGYRIDGRVEGINIPIKEWTQTNAINKGRQQNLLKILRISDKIYFSINGTLVYSDDFHGFRGNNIGFYIASGIEDVLFENLLIKQDISDISYASGASVSSTSEWKGSGSGFFVDSRGYIATNYHVVEDATDLQVEFIRNGQNQTYKAEIVQTDKQNDVAIIKVIDNSFKPFIKIPYNFKQTISDVGTNVFTLGYPLIQIMGNEVKFTDGKISAKTGFQGDISSYQISIPIQAGNSGGPLFDYDGNLIGITSAGVNKMIADNANYAIKSTYLKNLLDVLPITVKLPDDKTISTQTLTEKIKILSDYVVLIKVR
jgi:S1-C subfamily serine protease